MKHFRTAFIIAILAVLVYIILAGVMNVVLYRNRPALESQIAKAVHAQSVEIGTFFNVPFVSIRAGNVDLEILPNANAEANAVFIRYNVFKMLFKKSLAAGITHIDIPEIDASGSLPDLIRWANSFEAPTNGNAAAGLEDIDISARIGHIAVSSPLIGQIVSEAQAVDTVFSLKHGGVVFHTQVYCRARLGNEINYLRTGAEFDLKLSLLSNVNGSGSVKVSGMDFGGIPLLQNESLKFSITNSLLADISDSILTNFFHRSEEGFKISLRSPFTMSYEPFQEFDLMEHILRPGDYLFFFDGQFRDKNFEIEASISNLTYRRQSMHAVCRNSGRDVFLKGRLETSKYGLIDADVAFEPGKTFPEGHVQLRDIAFAGGLKFGGTADCVSASNALFVRAKDFQINGGNLGAVRTVITADSNGIHFAEPEGTYNASIAGYVSGGKYDLKIDGQGIPGSAVVKNLSFDALGIGEAYYTTAVHIYEQERVFRLDADLTGYRSGERYVSAVLNLRNADLTVSKLLFYNNGLRATAQIDFRSDRVQTDIDFNGNFSLEGRRGVNFTGQVRTDRSADTSDVGVTLDNNAAVNIHRQGNSALYTAKAAAYSLDKLGVPGTLDLDCRLALNSGIVGGLDVSARFTQASRFVDFNLDTTKADNRLNIDRLSIGTESDTVYATADSILWQSEDQLNGKIYFDRGGSLKFEASADQINASVDLRNLYVKNFFQNGLDVLISAEAKVYGSLRSPDFDGSLSVVNSYNSIAALNDSGFNLHVDHISRSGGNFVFNGVRLRHKDYNADLNGFLKAAGDKTVVSAEGSVSAYDLVNANVMVMYQKQTAEESLTYRLNNARIGNYSLGNIQGGMIHTGGTYQFYRRNAQYGLNGFYHTSGGSSDWDLEVLTPSVQGDYAGNIANKTITANLNVKADLVMLSFLKSVFKKIEGTTRIALKFTGDAADPDINGKLAFFDTTIQVPFLQTSIRDKQFVIPVRDSKLVFSDDELLPDGFVLPTTTGNFKVDGYLDISGWELSYLDVNLSPADNRDAAVTANVTSGNFELKGSALVKNLRLVGPLDALLLTGDATVRNTILSIGLGGGGESSGGGASALNNLKFKLNVTSGGGVKFSNQIIDMVIAPGQTITLLNSMGDGTFTLDGDMIISRGTISYLGRDFQIQEGQAKFSGQSGDPIPWVSLITKSKDVDQNGENIEIYLTLEGKLSTITIKDFYSIPDRTKSELYALLGFETSDATNSTEFGRQMAINAVNVGGNMFLFNPLSMTIRRTLGLDLFVIRSGVLGNFIKSYGGTNMDPYSLLSGTSVSIGKYLFSNVFLEYDFELSRNSMSPTEFNYLHTLGIGFDYRNFYLGYKWAPIDNNAADVTYEHRIDMTIHGTF